MLAPLPKWAIFVWNRMQNGGECSMLNLLMCIECGSLLSNWIACSDNCSIAAANLNVYNNSKL
jgi:hypothetical protein